VSTITGACSCPLEPGPIATASDESPISSGTDDDVALAGV
jgi:hypothetical protein